MFRPLLFSLLALLAGCASLRSTTLEPRSPRTVTLVWAKDFDPESVAAWQRQAWQRFGNRPMVLICCHGDVEAERWALDPDRPRPFQIPTREAVKAVRLIYPDRLIVLLCCNPRGETFNLPHVAYAKDLIYIHPGRDWRTDDYGQPVHGIGNIFEFTVNR